MLLTTDNTEIIDQTKKVYFGVPDGGGECISSVLLYGMHRIAPST